MLYSGDRAAALLVRLAPAEVVRALGERGGVDFLLRHVSSVDANDPLVAGLVLAQGNADTACLLARHVGGDERQDKELVARLLALDDPEVNAALFRWGGPWTRWAVVKQFRYGDEEGPVPMAPSLRSHFLKARSDLVYALEAADDEVAEQAFAWIGRGVSQAQRARALHRSPSMPPWSRDELTALVRRATAPRAEGMAAFAEAAALPGPLGEVAWPPRGRNRGAPSHVSPPRWRVVRAIGQVFADGSMSANEVLATAQPAPYAILALDTAWIPGVRGQVPARARLRDLATRRLGSDPDAWSTVATRIGAGFRGTVPELFAPSRDMPEPPREGGAFVAEVLYHLFRTLGMGAAADYTRDRLLTPDPDHEPDFLSQVGLPPELRYAVATHRPRAGEPRVEQHPTPHEEPAEARMIGPHDPSLLLAGPFPERLMRCNDGFEEFGRYLLPHAHTFRLAAEVLHAGLGTDIDAWTVALHLARDGFGGSLNALVTTATAVAHIA